MKHTVILKSNANGITLILDKTVPFEQLLEDVIEVFDENKDFFSNSRFAIAFSGRTLTEDEEIEMVLTINQHTKANILRIISDDEAREEYFKARLDSYDAFVASNSGKFHKGTLKEKDILEVDSSIVILGDVLNGAKVISKGNVIILGRLEGNVHAGMGGNNDAFVAALTMEPSKMKISDLIYVSDEKKRFFSAGKQKKTQPMVAKIQGGRIEVSPLIS